MINCLEFRPIVTDKETRDEPHGTWFSLVLSCSCPEVLWISPLPVYCTTDCLTALLHLMERTLRTGTFINKEKTMQFVSIE